MAVRFSLTIDCVDPNRLMKFWAIALGYKPKDPPAGFEDWRAYFRSIEVPEEELQGATDVYLVDPDGVLPQIFFQQVPEGKIAEPRTGRRMHLDVMPTGGTRDEEVVRLKGLECD